MNRLAKPRRTYLPAFREWIRGLPCLCAKDVADAKSTCDGAMVWDSPGYRVVTEVAHVKSRGSGGDDPNNLIPLCGKHHRWGKDALHALNVKGFDKRWGVSVKKIARQLYRTWRQETQA